MSSGNWPFIPECCPRCRYFHEFDRASTDESGYETLGFCRHPRIAMPLFRTQKIRPPDCPLFIARPDRHPEASESS